MKEQDIMNKLTNEEKKEMGFESDIPSEEELDNLHKELGIDDENDEDIPIIEKEKETKVNSTTKKKKTIKKEQPQKMSVAQILKNVKIDVQSFDLSEESSLETIDNLNFILSSSPSYQVVANQSGYIAHMESMKLKDISAITNSTMDFFYGRKKIYQTVYNKIADTSLGKISYKDWLKITSFYDFPTLLYGIYCQTFPSDTDFQVKCKHCGNTIDLKVNNNSLICTKNDEVFKNMSTILKSHLKPSEVLKKSLVNKYTRFVLPDCKFIVDIQTPSLWNYLNLISSIDKNKLNDSEEIIGILLFIKNLFIPDIKKLVKTGKLSYVKIEDNSQIFNLIKNLEIKDASALGEDINERSEKYAITYKLKSVICPKCENETGEIILDMEKLLFNLVLQM